MAKICVTEKTAARQRWIEKGLQDLMLTRRFEEITVTDLCRYLKLSRRSFYRYFKDMDDVLDSLMHHTFQDLATPNTIVDIRELAYNFTFWLQRRDLLDALYKSGMSGKLMQYTLQYTDFNSMGNYLAQDDPGLDCRKETWLFVIGGLVSMVIAWQAEGFQKTPERMAQIAHRMLFQPILKKT